MKFVDVHFEDGCRVGKVINEYADRYGNKIYAVEFDDFIVTDLPESVCTLWYECGDDK